MESVLREVFQLHQIDVEVSSRNIQQLLHQRLSALAISATEQRTIDESQNINNDVRKLEGRLGPLSAGLNKQSACGVVKYSQNDLEIESHSNFCSIRGNVCLFKGKWMYEVVLGTSGIQQIGWTQLDSPFTNEEGVGDSPDSYAYDGKRIKKWSVQSQNYGSQWVAGDVIGCCIDLDQGQIHFSRNGSSLGAAFSNIKVGERGIGLSYFPGLSLSHGERALLNFGAKPFIYPVEGYQPIHIFDYNLHVASSQAGYLLQSLNRLLMIHIKSREYQTSELRCKSSDLISIGANILSFLMPLITKEYILQSAFYPFLMDLFRNGGNSDGSPLIVFLNLLLATVSDNDLQDIFGELFEVLSLHHRTASYANYFSTSKTNNNITHGNNILADLQLTLTLLKIPTLLRKLIVHPNFSDLLEKFFIRKPLSKDDLSSVIPLVWWQNAEEEGCSKEAMDESVSTITKIMEKHESYLFDLFAIFALNNTSVTIMTGNERVVVSVQNVFRQWLRSLVKKNKGANRNIAPPGLSDPSAIVNLFFCMVNYLSPLQENSNNMVPRLEPKMFPPTMFYDERALEYFDFPRIGGLLGHLQKTFPLPSPLQPVEIPFEVELFDDMTYFHHLIISIAFKNASAILQSQNSAITQLDDTNKRIKRAQEMNQTEGVEHLTTAKKVFRDDACDLIRQSTWNRQILFSRWKQEGMFQLMALQMNILEYFSREQPTDYEAVFNYVPESYIDTFIDMFHALRRGDPPFSFVATESRMQIFCKVINTLSSQFVDKRIINPDIRDLMLQSLSVLLQYQEFVRVFESPLVDKEKFLENLLSSFDARFWIPISNILLRFWKDCGFAQALKPNELQVVSKEYRKVFRDVCTKNQGLLNDWLNKVFNNLNWAITEFGVAAKDLQAALPRHIAPELQQHQRKVNVMFELSVTLAKLLEFVSLELPETFLNPAVGQELNINRLAELLLFILNRCTVGTEAKLFQDLLKVNMIALDKVNRASILAPVVGTIVNLQQSLGEQKEAKYKLVPVIVSTGFSKDTFEFLLTVDWSAKGAASENMTEYDGLAAKLETLKGFIVELQSESSKIEDKERSLTRSDSSDFCSICCSAPVDTRFEPCHHRSCYKCIKRHLLNNKKCFFCNTPITNIVLETNNNANETVE